MVNDTEYINDLKIEYLKLILESTKSDVCRKSIQMYFKVNNIEVPNNKGS